MSDDILRFLENQIKLENKIVKSVSDALETIENEAVTTALRGVSLDSSKHAEMYRSAISLLMRSGIPLDEKQLDVQKEVIERHIKLEEAVIEQLDKMIPKIENEKIKLLLRAILQDEHRHHKLLKTLLQVVVSGETITDADWYEAIWGDVPGLWA